MAEFHPEKVDMFLGVVRKYMQVRGPMSQKELAELIEVGDSTVSRFLNQKSTELNSQLIAKITAKLNIPLHEIIDFVEEEFADKFIRLVKFYKEESPGSGGPEQSEAGVEERRAGDDRRIDERREGDEFLDSFSSLGTSARPAKASVSAGGGKTKRTLVFEPEKGSKNSQVSLRDKLENLTPRQKAYLTDFLNLEDEEKDLIVDFGNSLVRYLRQKGSQP